MSGLALRTDLKELRRVEARLAKMTRAELRQLLENAGAVLESSARRRIQSEKRGPDGQRWANWSESYAATRRSGHGLLSAEGHLLDSIRADVRAGEVEVGTNLVYGAIHQFGGAEVGMHIPPRPYLGVSLEDERDVLDVTDAWIDMLLEGLQ